MKNIEGKYDGGLSDKDAMSSAGVFYS